MHVTKKYLDAYGGDSIVVSSLKKYQCRDGDDVFILTSNCEEIVDDGTVTKFGVTSKASDLDKISLRRLVSMADFIVTIIKLIRGKRPDVIHSHSPEMGFVASHIGRLFGIPTVHTCHGIGFSEPGNSTLRRYIEVWLLRYANYSNIIVLSRTSQQLLRSVRINNTVFIPNGVDLDFWHPTQDAPKRQKYTFVSVGRIEDQKGFEYLLRAVSLMRDDAFDFRLLIVGNGSKYNQLVLMAKELRIDNIVEFLGSRKPLELRSIYESCHCFVLASIWEGLPLTILEALAMEIPVIATDVGDIREIVGAFITIVNPASVEELVVAMERILLSGLEGFGGYGKVPLELFGWTHVADETRRLYLRMISA